MREDKSGPKTNTQILSDFIKRSLAVKEKNDVTIAAMKITNVKTDILLKSQDN